VVAALLTGMGRDGAAGLLDLRRSGATTLAQDEDSSVVYGMPGAAWDIGAVQQRLALPRIGAEILRACAQISEGTSVIR
jgi:two-component system chemotaxis response regulator CheB